jgi:hypothetical protein
MMPSPPRAGAVPPAREAMPTAGMLRRPYADEPGHPSATSLGGELDPAAAAKARLASLPPDMQAMIMGALGADPLVASAFLAVLGQDFAPLIQEAMQQFGPQAGGGDAAMMGTGGAAPDQQMQMQGGAGMIPGMMGG